MIGIRKPVIKYWINWLKYQLLDIIINKKRSVTNHVCNKTAKSRIESVIAKLDDDKNIKNPVTEYVCL